MRAELTQRGTKLPRSHLNWISSPTPGCSRGAWPWMVVQMVSVPLSDALADPKLSEAMTGAGAGA